MLKLMTQSSGVFASLLAIGVFSGCGGSQAPETAANNSTSQQSAAQETVVADTGSPADRSEVSVIQEGATSKPAQCVAVFLDSLRRGDQRAVNAALTAKAREELAKTSYVIEPLGAPDGKFEIGRVAFPYEDKTVALVECVWTDPPAGDQPAISMDVVCEVHQEPQGWRMSALGLTIPGTNETLVLDFEDAQALQATIDAALGVDQDRVAENGPTSNVPQASSPTVDPASQVRAPGSAQSVNTASLPAVPANSLRSTSQNGAAQQNSSFDQIAFPPATSDPIKR